MKKFLKIIFIFSLLINFSCLSSMIKSSIKDSTIGNKMLIHSNPRIGDYAIFKGAEGNSQMTLKITGKRGSNFIIRSETGINYPNVGLMGAVTLEFFVTRNGSIKKAFLIDGNEKFPLKIAKKNDKEYMNIVKLSRREIKSLDVPKTIIVPAGKFRVRPLAYKTRKDDKEYRTVYLLSKKVKFQHVASYTYYTDGNGVIQKHQSMRLEKQGNKR
jgi:hypothetical protein